MADTAMPRRAQARPPRRLIAAGIIARRNGVAVQITRTERGTRGLIRRAGAR